MQTRAFERFLKHLSELTERQRERLFALLLSARQVERVTELIEHTEDGVHACPRCGSSQSYRHGQAHGLQRSRRTRPGRPDH